MLDSSPQKNFSDIFGAYRGSSDGPFEAADYDQLMELRKKCWAGEITLPDGVDRAKWWSEQVAGLSFKAMPRGDELLPERIGYPSELLTFGA